MKTIVNWTLIFLLGSAGWWLGSFFGLMPALFISLVGSGVGMYLGNRLAMSVG